MQNGVMLDDPADNMTVIGLPASASLAFQTEIEATHLKVRDVLARLRLVLSTLENDADVLGNMEIAAAEALNNVAEHAYPDRENGFIKLAAHFDRSNLYLAILDSGVALPEDCPPTKRLLDAPDKEQELPEGGFGWNLIMNLCTDVRYQRYRNQNHLLLQFARNQNS